MYFRWIQSSSSVYHRPIKCQGRPARVRGPVRSFFFRPPPSPPPARAERLTPSGRVTWAWPEGINLYNRQIMVLSIRTKIYPKYSGPGPPSGQPSLYNLYRLPRPLVGTVSCTQFKTQLTDNLQGHHERCLKREKLDKSLQVPQASGNSVYLRLRSL